MPAPRSFAKKLRAFAADIPKQVNEVKKAMALEMTTQVVGATPVLSGQARNNWIASTGSPDTSRIRPGPFGPATRGGIQSLNEAYSVISKLKPLDSFHLSNNLPYIDRLNNGYSAQAPAMFVELAFDRARAIVRKQTIRYRGY